MPIRTWSVERKMTSCGVRLWSVLAFLGLSCVTAQAAKTGNWSIKCDEIAKDHCAVSRSVQSKQDAGFWLTFIVSVRKGSNSWLTLAMPTSVFLRDGVYVEVDGQPVGNFTFKTCRPTCIADRMLPPKSLEEFKTAAKVQVIVPIDDSQSITIPIALDGFDKAITQATDYVLGRAEGDGHHVAQSNELVGSATLADECNRNVGARSDLEDRKKDIDGRIKLLRNLLSDKATDEIRSRQMRAELNRHQEDLLEVLFALDCARLQAPTVSGNYTNRFWSQLLQRATPGPSGEPSQAVELTVYYATNRLLVGAEARPTERFGNEGIGELSFGRTLVSIPKMSTTSGSELPMLWKFERVNDPMKKFALKLVTPLSKNEARQEIAQKIRDMPSKAILVYVHGYNTSFHEAALQTAQLTQDLRFAGVPIFYSWPSVNRVRDYLADEETARRCEKEFERVLAELAGLPADDIYIVAHSMGNRIAASALKEYVDKGHETKSFREFVLAAPDISSEIFKSSIAPRLAAMTGMRTTIYASSNDLALVASKAVHVFRRVGESSGGVEVIAGMDTVDASNAPLRNLGHSYVVDSASVISDLRSLMADKQAVSARGLIRRGEAQGIYWRLPN